MYNAPIESFFGHMKDELDYQSCRSFEELRLRIKEYMRYDNHERKQWTRKKMTPVEYRNHLLDQIEGEGVLLCLLKGVHFIRNGKNCDIEVMHVLTIRRTANYGR
jgi:hypothetical protein